MFSEKTFSIPISITRTILDKIEIFMHYYQHTNYSQAVRNLINLGYAKFKEMNHNAKQNKSQKM